MKLFVFNWFGVMASFRNTILKLFMEAMSLYFLLHKTHLFSLAQQNYRSADKSLDRPRRKRARKHIRDVRDFNNIETRAVIKFLFLQGKAPKVIHAILRETLACFLPGRAKDLSAPLYIQRLFFYPSRAMVIGNVYFCMIH